MVRGIGMLSLLLMSCAIRDAAGIHPPAVAENRNARLRVVEVLPESKQRMCGVPEHITETDPFRVHVVNVGDLQVNGNTTHTMTFLCKFVGTGGVIVDKEVQSTTTNFLPISPGSGAALKFSVPGALAVTDPHPKEVCEKATCCMGWKIHVSEPYHGSCWDDVNLSGVGSCGIGPELAVVVGGMLLRARRRGRGQRTNA